MPVVPGIAIRQLTGGQVAVRAGGKTSAAAPSSKDDESAHLIHAQAAQELGQVNLLPIGLLLPADSPHLAGQDVGYVCQLAEVDSQLPPIVVHRSTMRVIDGMHRLAAAKLRGQECIGVRFFDGTASEAFVRAVELNAAHGLPLTQADRAAAAEQIIRTHPTWSDRRIASVTGMGRTGVASIRQRSTARDGHSNARVGRDGRIRPLSAEAARERAGEFIRANPASSLREVADACGISLGTARDVRERVRSGQAPVLKGRHHGSPPAGTLATPMLVGRRPEEPRVHKEADETVLHESALQNLRRDPSLQLTEQGRTLLQLLSIRAATTDDWAKLAGAVPAHRAETVAHAARQCAAAWMHLANDIEHRKQTIATKAD